MNLDTVKFFTLDDSALFVLTRVVHNAVPPSPLSRSNSNLNINTSSNSMRPSPLARVNSGVNFNFNSPQNQSVLGSLSTPRRNYGSVRASAHNRNRFGPNTMDDNQIVSGLSQLQI